MSLGDDQFGNAEPSAWLRDRYPSLFPAQSPVVWVRPDPHCAFAHLHLIQQEACEGCGWDGYLPPTPLPSKRRTAWRKLVGKLRLRRGYCPECYSSPPSPSCPTCLGSRDYGPNISASQRSRLQRRWEAASGDSLRA